MRQRLEFSLISNPSHGVTTSATDWFHFKFRMQYAKLGNSGLNVSRICLGCLSYGDPNWEKWVVAKRF